MKKDELLEKSLRLLVSVIGVFIICIVLLIFKINVNAESPSGALPYVVPEYRSLNSFVSDSVIDEAINYYYANLPSNVSVNSFMIYAGPYTNTYDFAYRIYFITNPTVQSGISPYFDFLQNDLLVTSNDYSICDVILGTDLSFQGFEYNISQSTRVLGVPNTVVQNNGGNLTDNYVYYYYGPDLYSSRIDGGEPVLIFTNTVPYTPDVFESGHAQEPSFDSDTIIDSSLHPNVKPTFPTYNTYNITNYSSPTIDTSTVETLLESLIDVVIYNISYLVSNIVGAIQNLWNNLGSFLEYLGDLLSYLFNRVVNTIKQTADNLYQNFQQLFEPVLNSFSNFINMVNMLYSLGLDDDSFSFGTLFVNLFLPSENDLSDLTGSMAEFDILGDVTTSITDMLYDIIDVLLDDSVYSFHIAPFTFCGVSIPAMEISFDWYLPYKSSGDIFISAFLIVGYLYWLWCRFAGIFHGITPDSQGAQHITVTDRSDQFSGFPY